MLDHLTATLSKEVTADQDLFASGLVSSMFAMQLVIHLEKTYGLTIAGANLRLANFRTVTTMVGLVLRLSDTAAPADGG
nr:phosphopantetheine-binding protein [Kibdelosporangium phytohabitans]